MTCCPRHVGRNCDLSGDVGAGPARRRVRGRHEEVGGPWKATEPSPNSDRSASVSVERLSVASPTIPDSRVVAFDPHTVRRVRGERKIRVRLGTGDSPTASTACSRTRFPGSEPPDQERERARDQPGMRPVWPAQEQQAGKYGEASQGEGDASPEIRV
jgi:hypothetical protein